MAVYYPVLIGVCVCVCMCVVHCAESYSAHCTNGSSLMMVVKPKYVGAF